MKKIVILIMCICFLLTSCSGSNAVIDKELSFWDYIFRSDDYLCCTVLKDIVRSIETKDKDLLLSLFSENTKSECPDLERQAEALLNYCSGKMISFGEFRGHPSTHEYFHGDGNYEKELDPSYDINTTDGSYRISFFYKQVDTIDRGNEGILSLYVIKAEDDIDLNYAYHGDGKYTPGIHIGIVYTEFDYE